MKLRVVDAVGWAWLALTLYFFHAVAMIPRPFLRQRAKADFHTLCLKWWGYTCLAGHRVTREGMDRVPRDRPVIFVSNHQGALDIPLLHRVLPVYFRWLAKEELFSTPAVGVCLKGMDGIRVYPQGGRGAIVTLRASLAALADGRSLIVFPEGTWGDSLARMRPFKGGAITIARRSGCAIVPLTIFGSHAVNPPFTSRLQRGSIHVVAHPPIEASAWDGTTEDEALAHLRELIGTRLPLGTAPADETEADRDSSPF